MLKRRRLASLRNIGKISVLHRHDRAGHIGRGQDRPRSAKGNALRLPRTAARAALDAPRFAKAAQRLGRTESPAAAYPVTGEFFESGRRFAGRGNRLEPRLPALRLSGGSLLGAASTFSPGALRTAGPRRDGAKAQRAVEHGTQDHARRATLRPDFASRTETGASGRVLFVHVAARHGRASHRYCLSTERLGRFRSLDLSTRRVAAGIAFVRK